MNETTSAPRSPGAKLHALGTFLRQAWHLTKPYFWHSQDRWKGRALLVAIVALNLALVYMSVLFNDWYGVFYNALQEKNAEVFWTQLGRFSYLAFGAIILAVYKFYLTQLLEMRWRQWMTTTYLQRWLTGHTFYRLELARFTGQQQAGTDNPDQRIQDDINGFTSQTIGLSMGLLNSCVTLVSFVGILWGLSGDFSFHLGGSEYFIPGFMVWMAVLYCGVGSVLTHYIGRRQIPLNFEQQRVEADFRHHMVRVREYSESIALDQGETVAQRHLGQRFERVLDNTLRLIKAQKNLVWFTSFFGQAAVVFPFVVAAPRFFSGAIQMGTLMQIASAFGRVQDALSWFVDSYQSLAAWRATTDRLTGFEASFLAAEHASIAEAAIKTIANTSLTRTAGDTLQAQPLQVHLPDGSLLLAVDALTTTAGEHVLLQGPSGSGKSTLFRALSGIWPHASGQVQWPAHAMVLPQKPYFPNGALRDALAYPELPERYTDAQLQTALREAELGHLCASLDTLDAWNQKLSGGEQQRLAIARALLHKPQWLLADEATSALDIQTEETLYQRLLDMLQAQGGTLISIAHRPTLARFHRRTWELQATNDSTNAAFALHSRLL
ncbi:ABC transporter ATP-binding protein/permease [Curvibacter sp. CHRR-16]|uniref:ABC transporter ATP-binding protein/permease n=1 Tax=Curvibacter sp. CHRR-16 TaxID=2835872 RepID=UPI001BD96AB2|nr:ABC transporter ATP-binding protein/permease [Curvibacter sp. CHRR-16]MBT0569144.1 ABC transporter ATP-binding protein/permease [Curvibacter sp. CHRR-16]